MTSAAKTPDVTAHILAELAHVRAAQTRLDAKLDAILQGVAALADTSRAAGYLELEDMLLERNKLLATLGGRFIHRLVNGNAEEPDTTTADVMTAMKMAMEIGKASGRRRKSAADDGGAKDG